MIEIFINGIKKLFSTLWSACTYPYHAVRSLSFIPIYPARVIFNPKSNEYRAIRRNLTRNANLPLAHIVNFDLQNNMQPGEINPAQKQDASKRYFDAAIFTTDFSNIYNPNKQFIIMAGGNATCYEQFAAQMHAMTDDDTNVIGFNPMGVGMSLGVTSSPDDYQAAIKSIIDNLHKNGVPHDRIVLQGQSLGAAMCLAAAEQYQERGQRVKVIADRTFARLDNTAATMIWPLYVPIKLLVNLLGLNIYAATAFNNINQKNPGDAIGLSADNDGVIPASCNLYNGVSDNMRQQGFVKKFAALPHYNHYPAHNLPGEYIQENESTNNRPIRSGAKFTEEHRQKFKREITRPTNVQPSLVPTGMLNQFRNTYTQCSTPFVAAMAVTGAAIAIASTVFIRKNNLNRLS